MSHVGITNVRLDLPSLYPQLVPFVKSSLVIVPDRQPSQCDATLTRETTLILTRFGYPDRTMRTTLVRECNRDPFDLDVQYHRQ
jgi:hypothetical protein